MQSFFVLLTALGSVVAMLTQLLSGIPAETGSHGASQVTSQESVLRNVQGDIVVNGISVGMPRDTVEGLNPDFPKTSTDSHSETGQHLAEVSYKNSRFYFTPTENGSKVERISVQQTPDGIKIGSPILDASAKYSAPIHAYRSSHGHTYAVYDANSALDLAWVFAYDNNKITEVIITSGLEKYKADAKAAKNGS